MGRGNVCTAGSYEGLFYIDNEDLDVYRKDDCYAEYPETGLARDLGFVEITNGEWLYDEIGTMEEIDDVLECFMEDFTQKFPSFCRCKPNEWISNTQRVLLMSSLFCIAVEDNEWSLAVELIQRVNPDNDSNVGLQKRHYQCYLDGMKSALLNRLSSIGCYTGAWTHGTITREELN